MKEKKALAEQEKFAAEARIANIAKKVDDFFAAEGRSTEGGADLGAGGEVDQDGDLEEMFEGCASDQEDLHGPADFI